MISWPRSHLPPARIPGVLKRAGHTEGALDLVKLAGLEPAAVVCEILQPGWQHGPGAGPAGVLPPRGPKLPPLLHIQDVLRHRILKERIVQRIDEAKLPTSEYGDFSTRSLAMRIAEHT